MKAKESIFKTPCRDRQGKEHMGFDYMEQIEERARRFTTTCLYKDQSADKRQQRLPGF